MKYIEFEKAFKQYSVFSIKDIKKQYPNFDHRRLVEWQNKKYILKIKRGYYCLYESKKGEGFLFLTANKIYNPSYISLESALAFYNLIPEGVFTITSITTRNTADYSTLLGAFNYKHIKPELFFGYKLIHKNNFTIKIADPEKLMLDYFYMNKLNSIYDIEEARINIIQLKELINFEKMDKYQKIFNSRILDKRVRIFLKIVNA